MRLPFLPITIGLVQASQRNPRCVATKGASDGLQAIKKGTRLLGNGSRPRHVFGGFSFSPHVRFPRSMAVGRGPIPQLDFDTFSYSDRVIGVQKVSCAHCQPLASSEPHTLQSCCRDEPGLRCVGDGRDHVARLKVTYHQRTFARAYGRTKARANNAVHLVDDPAAIRLLNDLVGCRLRRSLGEFVAFQARLAWFAASSKVPLAVLTTYLG